MWGPGALVAAAFIGPGTVTSCSISGATAGYTLLWAMLLSVISVIIMQSMAARLGIVSGMGLGEALREKFTSSGARVLISILVIAAVFIGNIAYETGNLTGSILGIQAAIPAADNSTIKEVLALILGIIAFALLFSGSYQSVENFLTALVVPYNIYLHAASAYTKWGGSAEKEDALLLPITGILLLIVANDAAIMKEYKNKTWFNVLVVIVIAIFLFIAARNMRAFITGLQALISG